MGGHGPIKAQPISYLTASIHKACLPDRIHYALVGLSCEQIGNKGRYQVKRSNEKEEAQREPEARVIKKRKTGFSVFFLFIRLFKGIGLVCVLGH